ncbi:FtsX-like permease family protein [Sorangium sp. So ce260]|uniref:ABC transporter permease n=1 Tax=Sorangium sp. So ce260 TaxID=3133291 RepID=UPI003F61D3A0
MLTSAIEQGGDATPVIVRGVTAEAIASFPRVRVVQGAAPGTGARVMVGAKLARAHGIGAGDAIFLEGRTWTVAGVFAAAGSAHEQEIWADLDELGAATHRVDVSSFTVRTGSRASAEALIDEVNAQRAEPLTALSAEAAFARAAGMSSWMAALGQFLALVISVGASVGGASTMFAAVARRRRELAVLRVVGYRPAAIVVSCLLESTSLALIGGMIGAVMAFALADALIDVPFLVRGAIRPSQSDLLAGLALALVVGLAGGLLPALQAARSDLSRALR